MNYRAYNVCRVTVYVLVLALALLVHAPWGDAKTAKKPSLPTKTAKKSMMPAAVVRGLEGVWRAKEYYELREERWVKADSDLGYAIIIKGKKICPRSEIIVGNGPITCLGEEAGYGPYELVRKGDGFLVKKDIVGSPVSNEDIIYRKGRLELITYGMGTAKYILKKTKQKP